MHYFQFQIKEWMANTSHLTLEEEAIYLRLINWYYDSERPIPIENKLILRKLRLDDRIVNVQDILEEFFCKTDNGWIHKRCDIEIAKYHSMAEAGKKGALKRWAGHTPPIPTPLGSHTHPNATPMPIINKELIIKNKELNKAPKVAKPEGISDITWSDYLTIRKAQKKPITETALKGLEREALKAKISLEDALKICCERNWIGFKADWIANLSNPIENKKQTNWWLTDESVMAKGRELGINARAGESMGQYKQRIQQELNRL